MRTHMPNTPVCTMCTLMFLVTVTHMHTHTLCSDTINGPSLPDRATVADARDSVSAADVEGVEGPGLRDIDDAWVLLPEYRVIP